MPPETLRHLVIVLGDQLDLDAACFDGFDPAQDAVWMAEVAEESTHVPSSKQRTTFFLSAMRHFAQALRETGRPLHYTRLDCAGNPGTLAGGRSGVLGGNSTLYGPELSAGVPQAERVTARLR